MSAYPFIEAEKAEPGGNVKRACTLFEVSRSAYYSWSRHIPSMRKRSDAELSNKITAIHDKSRHTYGAPRITAELARQGIAAGKKRVARLMAARGLAGRRKRRFKRTTIADPTATDLAIDLLQRTFGPEVREVDAAWCGDITYVRTWEGWLYLASVIDLASRRVVGFAMAAHMRSELVCDALKMALRSRRPAPGLIFHSDRGSQYTSGQFRELLEANGVRQSLSRARQCWDNAVGESWFSTLKEELVYRHAWPTRAQARRAIFEFVEVFYNRQRLHSSLNYLTPVEYEERRAKKQTATQAA